MQAAIDFLPRLRSWSTGQQTSPEQEQHHHTRQRSQSVSTPPSLSSTLHNASPSLRRVGLQSEPESEVTLDAHLIPLPDSPPRCATPRSAMDPIHERLEDNPTATSATPLSTDEADQVYSTETDATLPSENEPAHPLTYAEDDDGSDNQTDELRKQLAPDRMAVMGLRSDAQEHGKALRSLLDQSLHHLFSVVAVLKENTSSQVSNQLDAISSLLASTEHARKVFHRSQERLLKVEWSMMEKENKLYARHGGKQSPISMDDFSEDPSDLPSVALPPSSDEDQHASAVLEQGIPSIYYGEPIFRELEGNVLFHLKDALMEPGILSSTTLHNELGESIQMLLDGKLSSRSPNFDRPETEDISLHLRSPPDRDAQALATPGRTLRSSNPMIIEVRPRQYGAKQIPPTLSYLGSWFTGKWIDIYPANQDSIKSIVGNPLTADSRPREDPLLDGIKPPQSVTIRNRESLALGLPISEDFDRIKNLLGEDVSTTRTSLLNKWLWGTDTGVDDAPNIVPIIGRTDAKMQGGHSGILTGTTLVNYADSSGLRETTLVKLLRY